MQVLGEEKRLETVIWASQKKKTLTMQIYMIINNHSLYWIFIFFDIDRIEVPESRFKWSGCIDVSMPAFYIDQCSLL